MHNRARSMIALVIVLLAVSGCEDAQPPAYKKPATRPALGGAAFFEQWPQGQSPREVGGRVGNRFAQSPHPNFGRPEKPKRITYPEVCAWYGALTFADVTDDQGLRRQLVQRFDPLFGEEKHLIPVPDHVDHTVFAAVPLELYMQTSDSRYLKLGKDMADKQWGEPFGKRGATTQAVEAFRNGLTWQTRMWIDDMFMITIVQAQAYRATGDRKYIDRAAREMVVYLDELQKENGLFHHAPGVPFFWGRGDGWMAAGMSELLRALPQDSPDRPRVMKGYHLMMEALLKHQDEQGMWHQLIDDPTSWPETSCTGMFTFAFITGVTHGWLDEKTYGPGARKGWLALTTYLEPNGDIRDVCEGTNAYNPMDARHGPDGRAYYLARKRVSGDMHGQAPVLWCAAALLRGIE